MTVTDPELEIVPLKEPTCAVVSKEIVPVKAPLVPTLRLRIPRCVSLVSAKLPCQFWAKGDPEDDPPPHPDKTPAIRTSESDRTVLRFNGWLPSVPRLQGEHFACKKVA